MTDKPDLIERLRAHEPEDFIFTRNANALIREAAAEIERLTAALQPKEPQ